MDDQMGFFGIDFDNVGGLFYYYYIMDIIYCIIFGMDVVDCNVLFIIYYYWIFIWVLVLYLLGYYIYYIIVLYF